MFFYDVGDDCVVKRLYHIDYINRASLQYVFFYDIGDDCVVQRLYHITFLGFLSSMCSLMTLEITGSCKGFTTLITFLGFSPVCVLL